MPNVIKQIIGDGEYGAQTIKMVVRDNERGPQGEQGEQGAPATIAAGQIYAVPEGEQAVINSGTSSNAVFDFYLPKGPKGEDGAIHYTAGTGIQITDGNVIEATGEAVASWGGIQGNIADQTDLQNEFAGYAKTADLSTVATTGDYDDLSNKPTIPTVNNATLTIQNNGTNVATFTANSSTNATANIVPPVQIGEAISEPTSVAYVDTANIVDTAVTAAKIANNAVTANKIDFTTLPGNYSTTEVNTGYTWVDGKTIYKKTIDFGALPDTTSKGVAHGITNFGYLVLIEGNAYNPTTGSYFPITFGDGINDTVAYVNGPNVVVFSKANRSDYTTSYITLHYTKSS